MCSTFPSFTPAASQYSSAFARAAFTAAARAVARCSRSADVLNDTRFTSCAPASTMPTSSGSNRSSRVTVTLISTLAAYPTNSAFPLT